MPVNLGMIGMPGMPEMLVIAMILLLVFGAKRLPEMGASMGKGIKEFKKSLKEVQNGIEGDVEEEIPAPRRLDSVPSSDGEPKKLSE